MATHHSRDHVRPSPPRSRRRRTAATQSTGVDKNTHRRQLPDLPAAADHAAQEPEPARSARHQPVHPAARAVRAGRAAAQAERPAHHAGVAAEDRAGDAGARLRRQDRRGRRRRPPRSPTARRPGASTCRSPPPPPITIKSATGQTVYTGTYTMNAGTQHVHLGRHATPTACNGRTATTRSRSRRKDASGQPVAIPTEIEGMVDSVDLTQNPPVLSIGGQNYTLDKIKRVVRH